MRLARDLILFSIMVSLLHCSLDVAIRPNTNGGGIETIGFMGIVVDSLGNVATNTQVLLTPQEYNPVIQGTLPDSMIDTTDSEGIYRIFLTDSAHLLENARFNLQAVHLNEGTTLAKFGIKGTSDSNYITDTLRTPGAINIKLPDNVNTEKGYLYVEGTCVFEKITASLISCDNFYIFPLLPVFNKLIVKYCISDDLSSIKILAEDLTAFPGDTIGAKSIVLEAVYNSRNSGLPCNTIYNLEIDQEGNMWAGTYTGGLAKFNGIKWEDFNTNNSDIPSNTVYSLAVDLDGSIWCGTIRGGLAKYNNREWNIYSTFNSSILSDSVYALYVDGLSNKWIGTDYGVSVFDGNNEWGHFTTNNSALPHNIIYGFYEDVNGYMWIGTHSGLAQYDGLGWKVYNTQNSGLPNNLVFSVTGDENGSIWIATRNGIANFYQGSWKTYKPDNTGPRKNSIRCANVDSQGNKWFGSAGQGKIMHFNHIRWNLYDNVSFGMPYQFERINDIVFSNNSERICIATHLDGILILGYE